MLISLDGAGRVTKWNRAAETVFGLGCAEVVGEPLGELMIAWDRSQLTRCIEEYLATRQTATLDEFAFRPPNREPRFLTVSITAISGRAGDFQGVLVLGTDITERRQLETQLAHAQKLESPRGPVAPARTVDAAAS